MGEGAARIRAARREAGVGELRSAIAMDIDTLDEMEVRVLGSLVKRRLITTRHDPEGLSLEWAGDLDGTALCQVYPASAWADMHALRRELGRSSKSGGRSTG